MSKQSPVPIYYHEPIAICYHVDGWNITYRKFSAVVRINGIIYNPTIAARNGYGSMSVSLLAV